MITEQKLDKLIEKFEKELETYISQTAEMCSRHTPEEKFEKWLILKNCIKASLTTAKFIKTGEIEE